MIFIFCSMILETIHYYCFNVLCSNPIKTYFLYLFPKLLTRENLILTFFSFCSFSLFFSYFLFYSPLFFLFYLSLFFFGHYIFTDSIYLIVFINISNCVSYYSSHLILTSAKVIVSLVNGNISKLILESLDNTLIV